MSMACFAMPFTRSPLWITRHCWQLRPFTLLAASAFHRQVDRIPVCVQVHDVYGDIHSWMEYFDPAVRLQDVQDVLAEAWRPECKVYARDSLVALSDEPFTLRPGDLLRVLHPGAVRPALTSLDDRLARPDLYFRRLRVDGFPSTPDTPARECLLQPLECPRLLQYSYLPGPCLLEQVMLSHGDGAMGPLRLVWPAQQVESLRIRQHFVAHMAGAYPVRATARVPIFVDARAVGFSVQCKASFSGSMPLPAFLDSIGLFLPDHIKLSVSGSARFDRRSRHITVREADLVCLQYDTGLYISSADDAVVGSEPSGAQDGARPPGGARGQDGHAPPDGPNGPGGTRERSPRLAMSSGSTSARSGGRSGASRAVALVPRRPMDAKAYLLDPIAAALRRVQIADFRLQLARSVDAWPVLLFQGSDLPLAQEPVAPPSPEGSSPSLPDTSDAEDTARSLPDLLRVQVVLASFQGVTTRHTLWYEEDEDISGFVQRAGILLNDDPDFLAVLPADPQPSPLHFTFLLCPHWWRAAGLLPVVICCPRPGHFPFMAVAFPGQEAEAFLPQDAIPPSQSCDAYVPPTADRARTVLQADSVVADALVPAATIFLQPSLSPAAVALPMREHLRSLPHVTAAQLEPLPPSERLLAVFLGFGFHQFCLELPFGSVPRYVASALGIPFESVYLCRQLDFFDRLTIAGRRPSLCFGFRNLSDMHRRFQGRGLFIDCRPLGRPVCFREILVPSFTAEQLCDWLEVCVPAGFVPLCRSASTGQGDAPFSNYHGETFLLWVDSTAPSPSPGRSASGGLPDEDLLRRDASSSADDADEGGTGRPPSSSGGRPALVAPRHPFLVSDVLMGASISGAMVQRRSWQFLPALMASPLSRPLMFLLLLLGITLWGRRLTCPSLLDSIDLFRPPVVLLGSAPS